MNELDLKRAQAGDTGAFERVVTPAEGMLWRVCWTYTRNDEDAKDCMQETMMKAWRSLGDFRGDSAVETWLYRICVTCCLDFLRKRKRQAAASMEVMGENGFDPPDPSPQPEDTAVARDEHAALLRAMDELPEDMRTPLLLSVVGGKRYEDIASITGTAVGTVKSRIARARMKLAEKISAAREPSGKASVQAGERRARS